MTRWNNICEAIGTEVDYNHNGATYRGIVQSVRHITTNADTFMVSFGDRVVICDFQGNGVNYNEYATAFVKCDDTPETRAAYEIIAKVVPPAMLTSMKATIRINAVEVTTAIAA